MRTAFISLLFALAVVAGCQASTPEPVRHYGAANTSVTLMAPSGTTGQLDLGPGSTATIAANGTVAVPARAVPQLLGNGFRYYRVTRQIYSPAVAPATADLVSVKAAALPSNGAIVIAAQPDVPRKLQVRQVDDGTHHLTAGTLTLVGTDGSGNAVSEVVSLITAVSQTLTTANAYATITSGTVAALAGNGGSNTLGIGVATALALPLPAGFVDLTVYKETVSVQAVSLDAGTSTDIGTDETVGTVDTTAGTIVPTSAPNGARSYAFWYTAGLAD